MNFHGNEKWLPRLVTPSVDRRHIQNVPLTISGKKKQIVKNESALQTRPVSNSRLLNKKSRALPIKRRALLKKYGDSIKVNLSFRRNAKLRSGRFETFLDFLCISVEPQHCDKIPQLGLITLYKHDVRVFFWGGIVINKYWRFYTTSYVPGHSPNWLKVSQHCCAMKLCRELGRVLNNTQFTDVYADTLICPRNRFFASQIIFFHLRQWARIGWLLWSSYTAQFRPAVFAPTQLLNELS